MPPVYPPPGNLPLYVHDRAKLRQLRDDDLRFQLEDFQTVRTNRGPVPGAGSTGYAGRGFLRR